MLGHVLECALWYNADVPTEKKKAEEGIITGFFKAADLYGVTFGPISWEDVDPMSPRVPTPPKHMKGNVRCLIGSAKAVSKRRELGDFTNDLEEEDLLALRKATKKAHYRLTGGELSDEEADVIINEHAIDVVLDELKQ